VPLVFIPSPAHNGFYLGPLFVHAYGLAYVVGVIVAVSIAVRRWEARGWDRELVYEVALWGFPVGRSADDCISYRSSCTARTIRVHGP
jgi:prolipoprotein diacylglyceryltransferase